MSAMVLILALLFSMTPWAQEEEKLSPRKEKRIIKLIRTAVSQKEADADRAQEALIGAGLPAIPLLHQALEEERSRSYIILYIINRIYQKEAGGRPDGIPAQPDVIRKAGQKFLKSKLNEARKVHEKGDHVRALKILDAILVLGQGIDFLGEVETLRGKVKTALYHASVLSARFETERNVYEAGEVIEVSVRLRNPGKEPLVIPLPENGTHLGAISLERWTYLPDGNWKRDFMTETLPLPSEIRLDPGDFIDLPYLIDTRGLVLAPGSYVALWLSGRLRPPSVIQGTKNRGRLIEIARKEIPLLAVGQTHLAEKPLEHLREILEDDRALSLELSANPEPTPERRKEILQGADALSIDIIPLAMLASREGLWAANEVLIDALDQATYAGLDAVMKSLSFLNSKEDALDKRKWQIWWLKVR
ncbi:MAG: hypothetical protein O7H41_02270 [Planctomycetota bacterium]|nr:hypothetical protein [Planctomycetota bacterium]